MTDDIEQRNLWERDARIQQEEAARRFLKDDKNPNNTTMQIEIKTLIKTTTQTGKPYCRINDDLFVWSEGQALFEPLRVGDVIEVEVEKAKIGNKVTAINGTAINYAPPRMQSQPDKVAQYQDRKAEFINQATAKREESIRYAAAQRDAILIVTTFYPELAAKPEAERETSIKAAYTMWAQYLYHHQGGKELPF